MIEQPLGWDDIFSHAQLQRQLQTPICPTNAFTMWSTLARRLKPSPAASSTSNSGASAATLGSTDSRSLPVALGSGVVRRMLESVLGARTTSPMSTHANFSLPGDVSASRRYWAEDIIDPEVEVTPQGTIRVPTDQASATCRDSIASNR